MSNRRHYYSWICNDEGQPIADVNVSIYRENSEDPVYIYKHSSGGTATNGVTEGTFSPQLTTDPNGYFEFWIADYTEGDGYSSGDKFKIAWENTGLITAGSIDHIDISPSPFAVDETDENNTKDKMVSNLLAHGWEAKTDAITFEVPSGSWTASGGNYYTELEHELGNSYPLVMCYDDDSSNSVAITAGIIDGDNSRVWKADTNAGLVVFMG